MPPIVATFLTIGFIILLFRRDIKERPNITRSLWIPFWWLVISCSREVSTWLTLFGIPGLGGTLEEGNPINRVFYLTLIVMGFRVLLQRGVRISEVAEKNMWLTIFLGWCLLAVLWSDFPFVSLKRWIKVIGQPIMALIVLTEPDPEEALVRLWKRCAYILLPVSILFIKYYPSLGRVYDAWSGVAMQTGITTDKNMLGVNCLILGFVFAWYFLRIFPLRRESNIRRELIFTGLLIAMNGWIFSIANSKTPLVSLCLGLILLTYCGFKWVNKQLITWHILGITTLIALAQMVFNVYGVLLHILGRDATLTERTELWPVLLKEDINPLLGVGFESFWLGDRLDRLWRTLGWECNESHNGYLETYLTLGVIGLILLICLLLATYGKACKDLLANYNWGRFRLGFLIAVVIYNWTEAGFKTTHPIFFMFYVIAIDLPERRIGASESEIKTGTSWEEKDAMSELMAESTVPT